MFSKIGLKKLSDFLQQQKLGITISLAITSYIPVAYALPDDSQQPIYIKSNSAVRDDKQGITIYKGNVNMEQGSMRINANTVTLYAENDTITKIIAEGDSDKRASFKQQPEPDQGDIEADAETIEYHLANDIITLLDNASLKQADGSMILSNKITYDVSAARVEAGGKNGQVETVITPQNTFE